jgi:biopolymer transport protein ExbD
MVSRRNNRRARKKARRNGGGALDVNVTSFADIAFLLIIFFLVVASIQPPLQGMDLDIPAGEKAEQEKKSTDVKINDGTIYLNDKKMPSFELFREKITEIDFAAKEGQEKAVMLEATGKVDWQLYFRVTKLIQSVGGTPVMTYEED